MTFLGMYHASGMFNPQELQLLQRVYDRIVSEARVTKDRETREDMARYNLGMYERGLWAEKALYGVCLVAARVKFSEPASTDSHRKFLTIARRSAAPRTRNAEAAAPKDGGRGRQSPRTGALWFGSRTVDRVLEGRPSFCRALTWRRLHQAVCRFAIFGACIMTDQDWNAPIR